MSDEFIDQVAGGLTGRLRSLVTALDRLDRLESGSGVWRSGFAEVELAEAALGLTLRALQTSANPANFAVLKVLAVEESQAIDHLIETTGIGRLVISECLNDLVQVGFATRLIDTDHAQITAAGASMVKLIDQIVAKVSEQYLASDGQ